jgi:hypothetical protein
MTRPQTVRHLTQLSVSNYYGGSTTSLAARRPRRKDQVHRDQLADEVPDKIKTRLDSLTPH